VSLDTRNLPIPPVDMVMPAGPQLVFLIGNGLVCMVAAIAAERYRRRTGRPVGFLLLLAGMATVVNEPVVDILGLCWFAANGAIPLFKAWGVTIPAFMLPVYCWYVGGQALFAYASIERGVTTAGLFRLYGWFALVNVLLEVPGLNLGIYAYYGQQPFELLRFPLWWPICNALMPIVMAALTFRLLPHLSGAGCLLIVLLGPMAAGMTNGAIAVPVWVALNGGAPLWGTSLAAVVSLCLGLTLAFLLSRIVAIDAEPAPPRRVIAHAGASLQHRPEFIDKTRYGGFQWKSSAVERSMYTKRWMKDRMPPGRRNYGRRASCCCGGTSSSESAVSIGSATRRITPPVR
jgi:hypothetical protein